jgi:hypothetical protein
MLHVIQELAPVKNQHSCPVGFYDELMRFQEDPAKTAEM